MEGNDETATATLNAIVGYFRAVEPLMISRVSAVSFSSSTARGLFMLIWSLQFDPVYLH